jgi:DNA-binding transcriptional ArsR family regulator
MRKTDLEPEQGELFADHRFFLMLSSLVSSQTLTKIKPLGLTVLVVLRCFADHRSGIAKVSHSTIAKYGGISRDSVARALSVLEEEGLIEKQKDGRQRNAYRIIDKVPVYDRQEKPMGEINLPYIPQRSGDLLHELKNFLASGVVSSEAKKFGMVFNVNITVNNNQQTTNINAETVNLTINGSTSSSIRLPTAAEAERILFVKRMPSGDAKQTALHMLRLGGLVVED